MENIIQSDINEEIKQNFIDYTYGVNGDRAIPDALTGLKPVARRILFIMENEGINSSKPHKKCARVVGDTMSRVHPHGDSSIYEALVRLAQPWIMRYPLIDWHGNRGSIAGDGAAHMRYTESRLSKVAEDGLLVNLKKKNIEWQPNYDESEQEPITLPAIMPNLLCNPNDGIGVALATNWLPHNLTQVGNLIITYIKEDILNYDGLAPDFPTGGVIINGNELKNIYTTGKGKAVIRGKYKFETRGRTELLVFTEIPYTVKTEPLLEQISSAYQENLITGISSVRDESDKKGLRIVFELEEDVDKEKLLKQIFKETNLQKSVHANQVALIGKTPKLLSWKEAIDLYVNHNLKVIKRESEFDLNKALERKEVVDGLLKALEDIDNVIALIKSSKSAAAAKENLISKYNFTDNQAKAIVDMKLGRLAGLEKIELQNEDTELLNVIENHKNIILNKEARKGILLDRLSTFIKKYGDERRTEVTNIEIKKDKKEESKILPEDSMVIINNNYSIKRVPTKEFKVQKRGGKGVKNQDAIWGVFKTNTIDTLMIFTDKGKMYKLLVNDIPVGKSTTKGVSINTLIKIESYEKIVAVSPLHNTTIPKFAIFITKNGMVKKTLLEEYMKVKRASGIAALNMKEGDFVKKVLFQDEEDILLITKNGVGIRFETKDITPIGRITLGVKGIKLDKDDEVISAVSVHKDTDTLGIFLKSGIGKKTKLGEFPIQSRGGIGVYSHKSKANEEAVVSVLMLSDEDNILICGDKSSICIASKDVPILGRAGKGNILIKDNKIVSVSKI